MDIDCRPKYDACGVPTDQEDHTMPASPTPSIVPALFLTEPAQASPTPYQQITTGRGLQQQHATERCSTLSNQLVIQSTSQSATGASHPYRPGEINSETHTEYREISRRIVARLRQAGGESSCIAEIFNMNYFHLNEVGNGT
jgi:hypothetical protein